MYDQKPSPTNSPQFDDFDDFMSKQKTAAPKMPKSSPVEDFDDFMSKGQSATKKEQKAQRREQLRQSITSLQDELVARTPQPQVPRFQPPIDMRLNAPNEAQKAFDRAAAATPKPEAPAPRPKQTLGQMKQQAGQFAPPEPTLQPATPEQRKQKSEQFLTALAADKQRQQAAAKAKLEEEASRASQSTLGRMGTRFARGAVRGVTQTPFEFVQMANPDPVVQQTMARIADESKEWQSQNLPVDNRNPATLNVFKPEFYSLENVGKAATENIPEVLGEMLPQMALARGAGGVARAASAIPRIAPTTAAEFAERAAAQLAARKGAELAARTAAGGYGAAQQSTQAYQSALAAGMTPEQAARAAAIEAPIGFSEFLGSPGTTGFTRPGTTIRREMREEGLQELGQTAASGLAGKYASGYDANKPLLDIAGESIGGGLLGAATGGIVATPGARLQARQQAQQQRATRSAIDQRSAANAAAITPQPVQAQPVTEPLTEPMAAQPQPSAPGTAPIQPQPTQPEGLPRLPARELSAQDRFAQAYGAKEPVENRINAMIGKAETLLGSQNENDRKMGERMMNRALTAIRQTEGYLAEAKLPPDAERPFTAVRDAIEARLKPAPKAPKGLNPEVQKSVDLAKQDAVEAEQAGNYEAAANHWKAAHSSLVAAQREIRRTGNAEQIKAIATDISIADANRRKANQAARTAQRQANAPTAGLPAQKPTQVEKRANAPQVESAPLLRPDAVQNPEGGVPQMPEPTFTDRLNAAARKDEAARGKAKPAKRLLSRIAELGGISDRYAGELQDVKDARRIGVIRQKAEMSPDVLARQLQSEGYDVDPEDLNTLWEAARRDIAGRDERTSQTSELERRLAEEEAAYEPQPFDEIVAEADAEFQPDTADLREVREFGKRRPQTEQFTEEPPTAPLARRREPDAAAKRTAPTALEEAQAREGSVTKELRFNMQARAIAAARDYLRTKSEAGESVTSDFLRETFGLHPEQVQEIWRRLNPRSTERLFLGRPSPEYAASEEYLENEKSPTAPLARRRTEPEEKQRATHPLVRLPLKMGEVGINEVDVDSILDLVNRYDELRDTAPNVQSAGRALAIAAQQNAIIRRLDRFAERYPNIKSEIEYALFGEWTDSDSVDQPVEPQSSRRRNEPQELPQVTAMRERETLPPVERREAKRQAVPRGMFGKLSESSYKGRPNALVENPQLRRLLGLGEMPAYRLPDAPINPKTGEPYVNPAWSAEAQNTLNALAELAGKERSSQIDFSEGARHGVTGKPTRSEFGETFGAVTRLARQKGERIDPNLRLAFEETATRARNAQTGWQEFTVDERTENIRQSLYDNFRRGKLDRASDKALRDTFQSVAEEYGLSNNQSADLYRQTRDEARRRAERAGSEPSRSAAAESGVAERGERVSGNRGRGESATSGRAAEPVAAQSEVRKPAAKELWQMTPEEYARSVGVEKLYPGFGLDASIMQLNRMSDRERSARSKERASKQSAYNDTVKQWEDAVWEQYQKGAFSALDVWDTDAFYVLNKRADMLSPFRLTKMSEAERVKYLKEIDNQIQQAAPAQPAAPAKSIDAQIKDIRDLQKFDLIDDKEAKRKIAELEAQRPKIAERRENQPSYEITGADLGELFHGGKKVISQINPDKLQYRDAGFYGKGFYVTKNERYAKAYGNSLTRLSIKPDARVLYSELNPQDASLELKTAIRQDLYNRGIEKARTRGKEDLFNSELDEIFNSPIGWKNAVDRFAENNNYDVVRHSDGEIVVKNPAVVSLRKSTTTERRSEAMPERYTGRQLFENAQLTFRPARNRPATLVANDWGGAMLNRLLLEKFDVTTTDANFTIGAKDAKDLRDYLAEAKDSGIYEPAQVANMDAMLKQMDAAIADAEANQQDVAFVTRRPAEPISATKAKIRHETAHLSQSRIAADLSALTGKNWLDSQPNAKDIHKELDRRGYAPETHDYEAAAFVASGDYGVFGMDVNQAAKFLSDYFGAVVEKHGKRALQKFGAIDPRLQPTLEAARRETEPGQTENQRRSVEAAPRSERRIGAAGEAGGSREGVRTERRERRERTARGGFSFGRVPEGQGQVLASFPANIQTWLGKSKPKEADTPTKPEPVPADWNQQKWAKKAMDALVTRDMPKEDREKFFDFSTKKPERLALLQKYMPSEKDIDALAGVIDRANNAIKNNDGDDLREAVWAARAIVERPATNAEKASALMRAAMFSAGRGRMRDLISNFAEQKLASVARIPGSAADAAFTTLRRMLTGEGERTFLGPRPAEYLKNRATDRAKQWKQTKDVWKGKHVDALEDVLQHREVNFDNKFLDKTTKAVFRAMGAADQWFFVKEYQRAIREQAELAARADVRSGVIAKADRQKQTDYYAAAPTTEMKAMAELAAKQMVFRNPNFLSDKVFKPLRENLPPGANFALDIVMPVDRTPTNIILTALEYSPLGAVKLAGQMATGTVKATAKTLRNRKDLPTRQAIKKALDEAFPPEKQRAMSRLFGRTVTGTSAPVALGFALASAGMATGFYDEDDPGEEAERREEGKMPNSVKIGGRWYELGGIAPLGMLIGLGATLHREMHAETLDPEKRYARLVKGFGNMAMELPALESAKQTVKMAKAATGKPSDLGRIAGNIGARFVPGLVSDIGQATPYLRDPYEREIKAPKSGEKDTASLVTKAGREFAGEFGARIPGVRRLLPPKMNTLTGKPVETEWSDVIDPFRSRKAVEPGSLSGVKAAQMKFDISSEVRPKIGEPDEIFQQRKQRVESWMNEYGDKLLSHPSYTLLTESQKQAAMESLRRRISNQQNKREPKRDLFGNIESFAPEKVIQSVLKSEATRPKREAGKLWVSPATRP